MSFKKKLPLHQHAGKHLTKASPHRIISQDWLMIGLFNWKAGLSLLDSPNCALHWSPFIEMEVSHLVNINIFSNVCCCCFKTVYTSMHTQTQAQTHYVGLTLRYHLSCTRASFNMHTKPDRRDLLWHFSLLHWVMTAHFLFSCHSIWDALPSGISDTSSGGGSSENKWTITQITLF